MLTEGNKTLKYIQGKKSLKVPFVIYSDLECLLEKQYSVKITEENLTQKEKKT